MFTFDAHAFLVPVQAQGYCGVIAVQSSKKIIHIFQKSVAFLSGWSPPAQWWPWAIMWFLSTICSSCNKNQKETKCAVAWKVVQEFCLGLPCQFITQPDPEAGSPPIWTNSWTCIVIGQFPFSGCSCLECIFQELKSPSWLLKCPSN